MTWTLTANNPAYNYTGGVSGATCTVPAHSVGITLDLDTVTAMVVYIKCDVLDVYALDGVTVNDTLNALQLNSTVYLKRDTGYWFRGYVIKKPVTFDTSEGAMMEVEVWGRDGVLTQSACPDTNGDLSWLLQTDIGPTPPASIPLLAIMTYGNFQGDTLWPDPTDAAALKYWLDDPSSNNDLLVTAIGTAIAEPAPFDVVITDAPSAVYNPRGWLKIGTEWFYYDGYDNATDSGGGVYNWRFHVKARGQLGSSTAAHLVGATVYEKVCKQIAPALCRVEREQTAPTAIDWNMVRLDKEAAIIAKLGCFVLAGPTAPATCNYRGTYSVYDEDFSLGGTYRCSVNDVVKKIVSGPLASGGAGFTAYDVTGITLDHTITIAGDHAAEFVVGEYLAVSDSTGNDGFYTIVSATFTTSTAIVVSEALPDATVDGWVSMSLYLHSSTRAILVNRYEYDPEQKPKNAWDAIQDLLSGLSLEEEIKFWYRHDIDKFRLRVMATDAKHFSVPHVEKIQRDLSIEDVYSAVVVEYAPDQEVNSIYDMYHVACTGAGGTPDRYITSRDDPDEPSGSWDMFENPAAGQISTVAGDFGIQYCRDGNPNTGLMADFHYNPAGAITFADFYFGPGATPPAIFLKQIELSINSYRTTGKQTYTNTSKTYLCHLEGATDYSTTTHTGTFKDLGFALEGKPNVFGKWETGKSTAFLFRRVNAVRLIWDYMAGPQAVDYYWAVVHDIKIIGSHGFTLVQLTDDVTKISDPLYIYAPETFEKLRGGYGCTSGIAGAQKVLNYDIAVGSPDSAISTARILLLTKLRQFEARHYEYTGLLPAKPELGLTIGVDETGDGTDDYIGVIRNLQIQIVNTLITCQAEVLDYDAAVIA